MTEDVRRKQSMEDMEEWFLEAAASDEPPIPEMLAKLKAVCRVVGTGPVAPLVDMMRDVLIEAGDFHAMLELVQVWIAKPGSGLTGDTCAEWLRKTTKDRLKLSLVKNIGFSAKVPVEESLRRLELLDSMEKGSYCYDKTWGFGIVKRLDDFYGKITIDFQRKRGHQMTFSYAGETLDVLPESHLLVRVHEDRDGLLQMARDNPGSVVKLVLGSLGDMTVADLKDHLTELLLKEGEWKSLWDGARKVLKDDALVEIPAKRSERIRLLASAKAYDDSWFSGLAQEKSREKILGALEELHAAGQSVSDKAGAVQVIGDRVGFAARGLPESQPGVLAQLLLAMRRLGIPEDAAGVSLSLLMTSRGRLAAALTGVGAKQRAELLGALNELDAEAVRNGLLGILPDLPVSEVEDAIAFLVSAGAQEAVVETLRPLVDKQEPGPFLACWLARHADDVLSWGLADEEAIILCAVDGLEKIGAGEELKAQKSIRQLFLTNTWLGKTVGAMDDAGRARMLARVQRSSGWDSSEKRSVLARLVKLYPELERVVAGDEPEEERTARLTSWRSLRTRQEQFRKLIEEDIPANSKDIGIARSYGDLRENFEYQAAKDQQRLLMRRKAEMEADLGVVKGTDFRNVPTDRVGLGVEVEVRTEDGDTRLYRILGEWDRDEELAIISSHSAVARELMGKAAGERTELPSPGGVDTVEIVAVRGLCAAALEWAKGR